MEGPASRLCLTTCYIKHCKPLGTAGNPPELGQRPLPRSCSCSPGTVKQEWPHTASKGALPIIPEYPGFQDVKLSRSYLGNPAFKQIFQDLERGKNCSPQVTSFPRRGSLPHCLGHSGGCWKGHQSCSPGFRDKPLQEYFNERLQELGSSQRGSRRAKGVAERSQSPFLAARGARRSSCSSVLLVACGQEGQQPCSPAHQLSKRGIQCQAQKDIQNVLKLCTGDFLDLLTVHIAAPLEVFVQKK